jgi:hypothetical protein
VQVLFDAVQCKVGMFHLLFQRCSSKLGGSHNLADNVRVCTMVVRDWKEFNRRTQAALEALNPVVDLPPPPTLTPDLVNAMRPCATPGCSYAVCSKPISDICFRKKRDWWEAHCCEKCQWDHQELLASAPSLCGLEAKGADWEQAIARTGEKHGRSCQMKCYGCASVVGTQRHTHVCTWKGSIRLVRAKYGGRCDTLVEYNGGREQCLITSADHSNQHLDDNPMATFITPRSSSSMGPASPAVGASSSSTGPASPTVGTSCGVYMQDAYSRVPPQPPLPQLSKIRKSY